MSAGFRWVRKPTELGRAVDAYGERVVVALQALGEYYAIKMQGEARVNAPWTDRTGNARTGLFGVAGREGDVVRVVLGHTMFYGVYLELDNGQRYAIVMPTIEGNLGELEGAVKALLA